MKSMKRIDQCGILIFMILRLSQKLARKVKVSTLSELAMADDPLTDWSANVFNASRTQYIIVCNTRTLYSTVMFARGINDAHRLIVGALRSIADAMEKDGLGNAYEKRVTPGSGTVQFGKAMSRPVTGSMNDLIAMTKWQLADGDVVPDDVGPRLNITPMSMLVGLDGRPHCNPREAMRNAVAAGQAAGPTSR
jgi:hypothetical protein